MEIDPEFWEWMQEGPPEERLAKNIKLIAFVRENRQMFTTTDEQLEKLEANLERWRKNVNKRLLIDLELRAAKYEIAEAERTLDETLMTEESLPVIPLFGKPKKDSH